MNDVLNRLSKSTFRNSFKLKKKDIDYINKVGIDKIREHAYDFINKRIRIKQVNDGKQTPTHGHPVFIAQHSTATCCRGCINKWHHMPIDRDLTDSEVEYIVNLIMKWIEISYKNNL